MTAAHATPPNPDPEDIRRYSRHILMPEIGAKGQERIRSSSVLIVGAGGLGSPALLYLAAAGVGRIGIIDDDVVDLTNLQRQVAHTTGALGQAKTLSARERAIAINPNVTIETYERRLTAANALDIVGHYDAVLDGSDNFPTRFLVNDACFFTRVPLISAAVFRFEGQLSTFTWRDGCPCYRCLFPEPPPAGAMPSCEEAGVLGPVVGTLGTMQATEFLKLVTGAGKVLAGRLLRYDALAPEMSVFTVRRNPKCALCGTAPTITTLREEVQACTPFGIG